ncbi:hypothetical protein C1645_815851 [Glomus cerebriforme]|uniref:Uncharacterized protein n=1 Tax=Glomus cerebriforme TaxID=658196 RepID=A0A397TFM2_9GLOM|nr:hypothetical protein C1645_815851 [Glomus cerebriforme]
MKSQLETTKSSKKTALILHQQNTFQTNEVERLEETENNSLGLETKAWQSQDKKWPKDDYSMDASLSSSGSKYPFCSEFLPYPLPLKIRLLLNKIAKQDENLQMKIAIHFAKFTMLNNLNEERAS